MFSTIKKYLEKRRFIREVGLHPKYIQKLYLKLANRDDDGWVPLVPGLEIQNTAVRYTSGSPYLVSISACYRDASDPIVAVADKELEPNNYNWKTVLRYGNERVRVYCKGDWEETVRMLLEINKI